MIPAAGDAPLRIGFVPIVRPNFRGDSPAAAEASLRGLEGLGVEVVTADVGSDAIHPESGRPLPRYAVPDAVAARRAAAELRPADLDLLLVQHVTFATGDLLAPLLDAADRVALWALPEDAGATGGDPGRGPLPLNALCGLNMTLSFLDLPGVGRVGPTKWFYGATEDPWFRERWQVTARALRGLRGLKDARVLQIGGTAPAFYGIAEKPTALAGLGVTVLERPLADLFAEVEAVADADADRGAEAFREGDEVGDASPESLRAAARIEVALRRMAAEAEADALAVRCWPELPEACGGMACAAMGDLSGERIPAACEGDVMGAVSMLALQAMTGGSAVLLDLSDLDLPGPGSDRPGRVQFWHCGNAPRAWAAGGRGRLTAHFNRRIGAVRDMTLRPGPATGFRLLDGGRRAAVIGGRFGDPAAAGFDGVRGWLEALSWDGRPLEARDLLASVLEHRLPHHFAFGDGELSAPLHELAVWLGAEVLAPVPDAAWLRHRAEVGHG